MILHRFSQADRRVRAASCCRQPGRDSCSAIRYGANDAHNKEEAIVDHPLPWLRYVDADDLDDNVVDFDGLDVESPTGEHLGEVDGFIVDRDSGRPYYVVVDSGGWFKSKRFLVPIGHARLESDTDGDALEIDVSRERIDRFPGFDKDEFEKFSAEDLKRFNDETCQICASTEMTFAASEPFSAAWDRPDYKMPEWWQRRSPGQGTDGETHQPFHRG
jgi:hypothetical protein